MPQGKGTYGSKVGRPKKKYNRGGSVDPFSTRNPVGVPAEQMAEAIATSNAQDRSQTSPDVTEYKEGGTVKKFIDRHIIRKDKRRVKKLEKSLKGGNTPKGHQKSERELAYLKQKGKEPTHKITGITKPKKKGLKPAKVPSNPPLFEGDTVKEKILNQSFLYQAGKKAGAKKGKKAGKKKAEGKSQKKIAPKGGHSLEPASKGRKKGKQWA